ncbi:MAG: hypothetical protein K2N34_04740 [Lachnospiraceae bacterium]|nr:hypothetical protein [Lachnospiraceae bacterium]
MYVLKNDLCYEINRISKIFVYGAGNYANKAYELLKNAGLKERIASFVVTEPGEQRDIDGIPIRSVNELTALYDEKSVVLIAVSEAYEEMIVQRLQNVMHSVCIIKLTEFIKQNDDFYEMLKKQSDEEFVKTVVGGYPWENIDSAWEFNKEIDNCIVQRNERNIDKNTIVYISGYLNPRSEKIISSLIKKKYNIVVLEYANKFINALVRTEIMSYSVDFFHCEDITEIYYRALQYQPLVYYIEPEWGDCIVPEIMIKHKKLFGKVVFAPYDLLNDGYVQISEKDKLKERYCLENADGIVWRWFSKEYLEEKIGVVYKGKSIQLLDYCKGFDIKETQRSDDRLKFCFVAGNVHALLSEISSIDDTIYREPAKIEAILSRIGNRNDCIFHLFVGRCNDSDREELAELEKKYAGFKFFCGTKYNEMIVRISEYDYGCFFATSGKDIPEQESIDDLYYGSIYLHAIANRYFDYLDANIPIIGILPKKHCDYLEKYGVIVKMNLSDLDIEYLKKNRMTYKQNVEKIKEQLLMDNHIQRLIDWFNIL